MSRYVGKYISTCDLCMWTKAQRQPPVGELHPLPIPDAPWDTISVDFITKLLDSAGHNAIMVVVVMIMGMANLRDCRVWVWQVQVWATIFRPSPNLHP